MKPAPLAHGATKALAASEESLWFQRRLAEVTRERDAMLRQLIQRLGCEEGSYRGRTERRRRALEVE